MSGSFDPRKYPPQFRAIVRRAVAEEEVHIPAALFAPTKPLSLRTQFQWFLRALKDDPELGPASFDLMVRSDSNGITICSRSKSKWATGLNDLAAGFGDADLAAGSENNLFGKKGAA